MQHVEKLSLLKSLHGLGQIPERQLADLAEFLRPRELQDGGIVFEEGAMGMSLYFVSSGQVRISKRAAKHNSKDLAVLGPGDFFGEMALIEEESSRSASAIAVGKCVLFELFRGDLDHWVKSHPQQAVKFFAELLNIQSKRLRLTTNEMTLCADLFNLMLDHPHSAPDYLAQVLDSLISYLEGEWSAAAYLHKKTNGPAVLIASRGNCGFDELAKKLGNAVGEAGGWLDNSTIWIPLFRQKRPLGRLIFHASSAVDPKIRDETERTLAMVSRPICSALEFVNFRSKEISKG